MGVPDPQGGGEIWWLNSPSQKLHLPASDSSEGSTDQPSRLLSNDFHHLFFNHLLYSLSFRGAWFMCVYHIHWLSLSASSFSDRFFMKLFAASDIEIVKVCQRYVAFNLRSVQILKRTKRLESKFLDTVLTTQSRDAVWDLCCLRVIVSGIYS